jgi:hypothetical protein
MDYSQKESFFFPSVVMFISLSVTISVSSSVHFDFKSSSTVGAKTVLKKGLIKQLIIDRERELSEPSIFF